MKFITSGFSSIISMTFFHIYYLCNRWDVDQLSLWLMQCEINHIVQCLLAVFNNPCDLRVTDSFDVWWLSTFSNHLWDSIVTIPFNIWQLFGISVSFQRMMVRILVTCNVLSYRQLPLFPIYIWDHIQGWIQKRYGWQILDMTS